MTEQTHTLQVTDATTTTACGYTLQKPTRRTLSFTRFLNTLPMTTHRKKETLSAIVSPKLETTPSLTINYFSVLFQ